MVATIALAEAKAGLSAVVKNVYETGAEYVLTVRGVPSALISPVPRPAPKDLKAKGALAGRFAPVAREVEKQAYDEALRERYEELS